MKAVYEWLGSYVRSRYGTWVFALLVFIEGFFLVPVSTLLAFYSLENRKKAFTYALIATLVSALGATAGYCIGMLIWQAGGQSLITYFISAERFEQLVEQFRNYQAWTTFIVAFTPMPFKVLTLTAGFLRVPLFTFIILAMLARGLRFFAIAGSIYLWGEQVHYYLNKYFALVATLILGLFVGLWFLMH
jgi:membrane protein YqaA with SNARE-associated domain